MKFFLVFLTCVSFLNLPFAQETVDPKKEIDFCKQKLNDLEKNLNQLAQMIQQESDTLRGLSERILLFEGAINELSLERKEEEKRLNQIEKYIEEEKTIFLKISETLTTQENRQGNLNKEFEDLKVKLKKIEEDSVSLAEQLTELRNEKAKASSSERKLRSKNPKIDQFLSTLESPWIAPIALGLAVFTFLLVIF